MALAHRPVHTRFVLDANGGSSSHSVFCKKLHATVPVALCKHCPNRVTMPADVTASGAEVVCDHAPDIAPTADTRERALRTPLAEIMSRRVVCVSDTTGIETLERLIDEGYEAIPVIDQHKRPIGIVTKTDVLHALEDQEESPEAKDVMTPFVHALVEDAPLSFGVALLALEGILHVPVISHEGIVVGTLSTRDIVRWLARDLGHDV